MQQLIECVPNFSEGRNQAVLDALAEEIRRVEGVRLLDVDPGEATNRTVFTFVGAPEPVVEAAFRAIKKAMALIDMRKHSGAHPRMGATDVCPLIPIRGISMEETVAWAHRLAKRVGEELGLPVYCYEKAAKVPERSNLATVRAGEYEGLEKKLKQPNWAPDYGPAAFHAGAGATAIGARNFLVAYNVNLNTTSVRRANSVAFDVREKGRVKREGNPITGKPVLDAEGNQVWEPGMLKSVKAIGWYIEEYGLAQISMNLTDISITKVHEAFDAVCLSAGRRGLRVTGSELVGLIPKQALLDAGVHYLQKQGRSTGLPEREIIRIAVKSLGLDELKPFDPDKKVIEYLLEDPNQKRLISKTVESFAFETASESPAPGGGSIAALAGALGASLGTMVANLSAHKRGWDDRIEFFSGWAERGQRLSEKLLGLVDEDTRAFEAIMEAFALPKQSEAEHEVRKQAIEAATVQAMQIPMEVMQSCLEGLEVAEAMIEEGMASSLSDAAVGVWMLRAGLQGAYLNVKINGKGMESNAEAQALLEAGKALEATMETKAQELLERVGKKL